MIAAVSLPEDERPTLPSLQVADPIPPLAFVSIATTGPDPVCHDILEIGIVRVDARSFEVLDERSVQILPERLKFAEPEVLSYWGFSRAGWSRAFPLRDGLATVLPLLTRASLAGHGLETERAFLARGFERAGLGVPELRPGLDTQSLAWPLYAGCEIPSPAFDDVAAHLRLAQHPPHRALARARCAIDIAQRLIDRVHLGGRLDRLEADEREIIETLIERISAGRGNYGPWHVDHDPRDYLAEAYFEMVDGLNYLAAQLVRLQRNHGKGARP